MLISTQQYADWLYKIIAELSQPSYIPIDLTPSYLDILTQRMSLIVAKLKCNRLWMWARYRDMLYLLGQAALDLLGVWLSPYTVNITLSLECVPVAYQPTDTVIRRKCAVETIGGIDQFRRLDLLLLAHVVSFLHPDMSIYCTDSIFFYYYDTWATDNVPPSFLSFLLSYKV